MTDSSVRVHVRVAADTDADDVLAQAKALDRVKTHIEGRTIRKEMVVPGRLVVLVAN